MKKECKTCIYKINGCEFCMVQDNKKDNCESYKANERLIEAANYLKKTIAEYNLTAHLRQKTKLTYKTCKKK